GLTLVHLSFAENDHVLSGNAITVISPSPTNLADVYNDYNYAVGNPSFSTTINCPLIFPDGGAISTVAGPGAVTESTADMYINGEITVNSGTLYLAAHALAQEGGANGRLHVNSIISGNCDVVAWAEDAGGHIGTIGFSGAANTFTGTLRLSTTGTGAQHFTFNK